MANYSSALDGVFLALSDPTRRAVVARLSHGPASVGELAKPFDMALPSFLKHIRFLESSGCIATVKQGRVRQCSLRPETLATSRRWLLEQQQIWEQRTDALERFVTHAADSPSRKPPRK